MPVIKKQRLIMRSKYLWRSICIWFCVMCLSNNILANKLGYDVEYIIIYKGYLQRLLIYYLLCPTQTQHYLKRNDRSAARQK